MAIAPLPSSPPDPRDRRVYEAVHALLAEQGMRLSMEAVAARAGCSKQTLYSRYGSKRNLLRLVILDHVDLAAARLDPEGCDLRRGLLEFACAHLDQLDDPNVVQTCRLIDAEAHQFPEEARQFYQDGISLLLGRLARWLQRAIARGQLRHDDPHFMAELLLGMIVGQDFERRKFRIPHRATAAARRAWAESAIDAFLRAFAPEAPLPKSKP